MKKPIFVLLLLIIIATCVVLIVFLFQGFVENTVPTNTTTNVGNDATITNTNTNGEKITILGEYVEYLPEPRPIADAPRTMRFYNTYQRWRGY